jgi:hypothetical protein
MEFLVRLNQLFNLVLEPVALFSLVAFCLIPVVLIFLVVDQKLRSEIKKEDA